MIDLGSTAPDVCLEGSLGDIPSSELVSGYLRTHFCLFMITVQYQ